MVEKDSVFSKKNRISYLYFPLSMIYLEIVVFVMAGGYFNIWNFIAMLCVSLACGMILNILASLSPSRCLNSWIAFVLLEVITFIYMVTFFVEDSYQTYVNIATVFHGATGILQEFGSALWNVILHNILRILLFEIPALLFLLLGVILKLIRFEKNPKKKAYGYLLLLFLVFEALGVGLSIRSQNNRIKLMAEYEFNTVVRCFNLQTGLKLDLCYLLLGNPWGFEFLPQDNALLDADSGDRERYGENRMELSYSGGESGVPAGTEKLDAYVESLTPSSKNQYTGLFKGKNLIFVSVEAMSEEMIREDTMPTLYRMMNNGIVFEDYYQPYWNGSTSTGEFANLLGLIPTKAMDSYEDTKDKSLPLTIGNELMQKGYFSRAYHNGTVEYYDRYLTHPNFGYEAYIANGNGMEEGLSGDWPESDLEMMQYALPQFVGNSPFNTYFMSLSGHFPYFHDLSCMVEKYEDRTKGLGYSDVVDAYICGEIDFEESIRYLVEELDRRDLLDDTVFVLAPDHYPYGLTKNDAFGTDKNYLPELYGYEPQNMAERDHNALIIWSPVLETMDPVIVSDPSYSVDILPTLLNLYGIEFDSRLLVGRDVLSDTEGLVIWPDHSFLTSKGSYDSMTDTFVSFDGEVDPSYVEKMKAIVRNKMTFSTNALELNYYRSLFN